MQNNFFIFEHGPPGPMGMTPLII